MVSVLSLTHKLLSVESYSQVASSDCINVPHDELLSLSALVRRWHVEEYGIRAFERAAP